MNLIWSGLLGIVTSIIGSVIFLYYILTQLRPKIVISPDIAHYKDVNEPDTGKKLFYFKFVNKSKHAAFDIRVRVCELIRIPTGNKQFHERRIDLVLRKDFLAHMPRHKKLKPEDTFAPFANISCCLSDLGPILDDQTKCVEIQIILRHGLTGLAKVFTHEYSDRKVVKNGMFVFGDTLIVS